MPPDTPALPLNIHAGLREMVQAFESADIRYALIGGIAVALRSRPRFTEDVDFLLDIAALKVPRLLEDLLARGFALDLPSTIHEWTQHHMTSLSYRGSPFDWLKAVIPSYQHILDRASPVSWIDGSVRVASSEGLILMKLLAFRSQDQADIESLLAANRGELDLDWVRAEWETSAALDDPRIRRFQEMVSTHYPPVDSTDQR
jgi:hypothetical protein